MPRKLSKRLVLDTNVVAAASPKDIPLQPKICREVLLTIKDHGHKVVMTAKTRQEWDKHQSPFAIEWRTNMETRGRIEHLRDEDIDPMLCERITSAKFTAMQLATVLENQEIVM